MSNTLLVRDPRELAGALVDPTMGTQMGQPLAIPRAEVLIQKKKGEPVAAFYARAEREGIARQCCRCTGRRKYSLVQCPYCGDYSFTEIKGQPSKPDLDKLRSQVEDPANEPHKPLTEPESNSGYDFRPIDPDSEEAKAAAEAKSPEWNAQAQALQREQARFQMQTFSAMDLQDLFTYAKDNGITLGGAKTKDKVIAKIEQHIGGFKPTADSTGPSTTAKALSEVPKT